jgi:hypothetical protein
MRCDAMSVNSYIDHVCHVVHTLYTNTTVQLRPGKEGIGGLGARGSGSWALAWPGSDRRGGLCWVRSDLGLCFWVVGGVGGFWLVGTGNRLFEGVHSTVFHPWVVGSGLGTLGFLAVVGLPRRVGRAVFMVC